jgi:hypothetical protein
MMLPARLHDLLLLLLLLQRRADEVKPSESAC